MSAIDFLPAALKKLAEEEKKVTGQRPVYFISEVLSETKLSTHRSRSCSTQ